MEELLDIQEPSISWEDPLEQLLKLPGFGKALWVFLAVDHGWEGAKWGKNRQEAGIGKGRICWSPGRHSPGMLLILQHLHAQLSRSEELSQPCKPKPHRGNWEELREEGSSLLLQNQRRNHSLKELQHISYKHLSSTYIKCPRVPNRWLTNPSPL